MEEYEMDETYAYAHRADEIYIQNRSRQTANEEATWET
jgi:hypothetical protein